MATTTTKETNPYLTFDDADLTDDFGFSFGNEDDIIADAIAPTQDEVADLKKRLEAIRKIYMPLLQNLAKNSDQPIIKWPNRGPILEKQIAKLITLTEPGFK
jgi:hypothetical protein